MGKVRFGCPDSSIIFGIVVLCLGRVGEAFLLKVAMTLLSASLSVAGPQKSTVADNCLGLETTFLS